MRLRKDGTGKPQFDLPTVESINENIFNHGRGISSVIHEIVVLRNTTGKSDRLPEMIDQNMRQNVHADCKTHLIS